MPTNVEILNLPRTVETVPIVSVSGTPTVEIQAIFSDGKVVPDDNLSITVKPARVDVAGVWSAFLGVEGQPVLDNNTTYVYFDDFAVLHTTVSGYPGGNHLRLGKVTAAGGVITNITDDRPILTAGNQSIIFNIDGGAP
jgi:hypothetical protein